MKKSTKNLMKGLRIHAGRHTPPGKRKEIADTYRKMLNFDRRGTKVKVTPLKKRMKELGSRPYS